MDECCCDKDACAKVSRDEEEVVWYGKTREAASYDWERTCYFHVSFKAEQVTVMNY